MCLTLTKCKWSRVFRLQYIFYQIDIFKVDKICSLRKTYFYSCPLYGNKSFVIVQREFLKEISGSYKMKPIRSDISRFLKKFRRDKVGRKKEQCTLERGSPDFHYSFGTTTRSFGGWLRITSFEKKSKFTYKIQVLQILNEQSKKKHLGFVYQFVHLLWQPRLFEHDLVFSRSLFLAE